MTQSSIKHIPINLDASEAEVGSREIVKILRPAWKDEDLKFVVFSDGITNKLIGAHLKSDPKKQDCIVIRIYGESTDLIIDRDLEKLNMRILHAAGCAAELYATFNNGIAYEFLPGTCLNEVSCRDPHIGRLVAKAMVQMHHVDVKRILGDEGKDFDFQAGLFKKARKFLSLIPDSYDKPEQQVRFEKEVKSRHELIAELDWLQPQLEALNSPVKFGHNDLLLGNIVYNKEKYETTFIDYEYGCFTYVAYDIADHFTEWAGVEHVDFSRYPDRETQLSWLRAYLEHDFEADGKDPKSVTDRDVEVLYVQVNKFAVMPHFFWGIWALIQAKYSAIDFDYMDYAILKLGEYFRIRDKHLALTLPK